MKQSAYESALKSSAYYHTLESGLLRVTGEDRIDFIQRQTSNDVRLLQPDRALLTVLTSPAARILDVLYLYQEFDSICALTLPGMAADTASFLKSRIFFKDHVTVQDESELAVQVDLLGPGAELVLERLGFPRGLNQNDCAWVDFEADRALLLSMERAFGLGYRLIVPAGGLQSLQKVLVDNGALPLDDGTYQILRVEAGLPAVGSELSQEVTPLETGLTAAVSDRKGCYTGQEVIARQITYDKVTRVLCGVRLEGQASSGLRLWSDGKNAGELTSVAQSPRFGWIGLAIVRRPHHEKGGLLMVGPDAEGGVTARIVSLPFNND